MITPNRADLAGLFTPPTGNDPFRQGVIVAFDPATGDNQVRVGGAVLEDLPILIGGDTVNFAPGDVVILLRYQSSWAILGRIVGAGNEALTATAVDFVADALGTASSYTITSSFATRASATLTTPAWANSLLLMAHSTVIVSNSSGSDELARVITDINGNGGGETLQTVRTGGAFVTTFAPVARVLGAGGPGWSLGASTQIDVRVRSNGVNLSGQAAFLNYIGVFRKV